MREAYYIAALQKQDYIDAKETLALIFSNLKTDSLEKKVMEYLEEKIPSIKEGREGFVEKAKEILEQEAGKEIDLSEYVRTDGQQQEEEEDNQKGGVNENA